MITNENSKFKAKYLKDYKKPDYLINSTNLTFEISPNLTKVTSILEIERADYADKNAPLVLNGELLTLISVKINDQKLDKSQYNLTNNNSTDNLTIDNLESKFTLTIENSICPEKNTALTGLYCSNKLYCTQCESHGFRRITYYLDRPDVMSIFTTKIIADKTLCPVLLSNGNCTEKGDLDNNKHFATWQDPFKKPSYLFALVAGDLAHLKDTYITKSGKEVSLELYSEHSLISQCHYGIEALKDSMKWDEDTFGREYDLDIYMIVAVSDFNMGAMENKGLNVFNTKYVLADKNTATDQDYINVQAVIAHEYFHNWTGNRITCRDWFQLSLKEGLTVFRDQEFTSDHHNRTVKRIEDARIIQSAQFSEDSSPMAHPIRPQSYIEMNNFYTVTVYNKGAEVIRMLHTLVGAKGFRDGMDLYFKRHDGQAVTCDDFVKAISDANNFDSSIFINWYNQDGTPTLTITDDYNENNKTYTLNISQSTPASVAQSKKKPFHIPIKIGLLSESGGELSSSYNNKISNEHLLELKKSTQTFIFEDISEKPVPSILRDFSAPVKIDYNYTFENLITLVKFDTNKFNKWSSLQQYYINIFKQILNKSFSEDSRPDSKQDEKLSEEIKSSQDTPPNNLEDINSSLEKVLEPITDTINNSLLSCDFHKNSSELAYLALLLQVPPENAIAQIIKPINPANIHNLRENILKIISKNCIAALVKSYQSCEIEISSNNKTNNKSLAPEPNIISARSLKNSCLILLSYYREDEDQQGTLLKLMQNQYDNSKNMSDQIGALQAIMQTPDYKTKDAYLDKFLEQWQDYPLLTDKWFSVQALNKAGNTISKVRELLSHPKFDANNPNKIYALLAAFALQNPAQFHHESGDGYKLIADEVIRLDKVNPQVASRLVRAFMSWKQYEQPYQELMHKHLLTLMDQCESKDIIEIVQKSLG